MAAGDPIGPCKEPQHISRKRKRARRDERSPTGLQRARDTASAGGSPPAAQQAPARLSPFPIKSLQPLRRKASAAAAAGNTRKHPAAADGAGRARPQRTVSQQAAKCCAAANGAENAQRHRSTPSKAAFQDGADQVQQTLVWCQQWLTCMGAASAARWCQLQQRHPDFTREALVARQAQSILKESSCFWRHTEYVAVVKTCS